MNKELEEFRKERDAIIEEIGEFDEEDFVKSGISLEEYTNPNEEVIQTSENRQNSPARST